MNNHFYKWFSRPMRQGEALKSLVKTTLMAITMLVSLSTFAQDKTISGKVTDASDKSGLPGVSVSVKGANKGTQTDVNGAYKIAVPANATLVYSFIGFAKQEIAIGNRSTIDVVLVSENRALEEVVVIGYGTTKVKDATGSVTSLGSKDFNKGVIASPEQLLQGRAAGIQITPSSGEPGAGVNIRIRGTGSIRSGNNPLFVVDGVPLDGGSTSAGGLDAGGGTSSSRNPLSFLNPNDIENISVLKDASAAAIYGSRGANGVVLITTKKGRAGQGFQFSTNFSTSSALKRYDILDGPTFLAGVTKAGGDAKEVDGKANTNWQDQIFRTSFSQNYDLSYGNGNENTRYRVGVGFSDLQGIIQKSGLSRLTGRLNLTQELLNDKLIIDLALTASNNKNTYAPISDNAGFQGSLVGAAIQANPTYPVLNANGTFFHPGGDFRNPAAMLAYIDDSDNVTRYLANISATYKLTSDLSYKFTLGLDNSTGLRNTWMDKRLLGYTGNSTIRAINVDQVSGNGRGITQNKDLSSTLVEHTLTYDKKMGKNTLNILGGYSYQKFKDYGYNNVAWGVKTGDVSTSVDGYSKKLPRLFGDSTEQQLQSYFARANYSIADKYFFTATVRADGSSKFGENNKTGVFPAFAFKYKLMNESFIPKDVFNDLSLRLNWGKTGNQEFPGGVSRSIVQRNLDNSVVIINAANPNIKWETTTQYGAGIDFAILQGKLSGTIDYFNKSTVDPIFLANYAQPAAVARRWVNLPGTIRNTGVEVGLNLQAVQSKSFSWEILANATSLKNIIEDFGDGNVVTGDINGQGLSGAYVQTIRNGYPLFSFFLPTFSGFDQNGFAILPNDNRFNVEGSAIPTFTWGLTNNFTFGKFNASIFFNGSSGNFLYNNTANALFTKGSLKNGRNVTVAVANSTENPVNPPEVSTRFLEKGDFIRLSNLSLGYTFNMSASSKIKTLRVNLAGQNLLLITDYSGLDPEVNTNKARNDVPSLGIDYTAYPSSRTFTLGVNLGF